MTQTLILALTRCANLLRNMAFNVFVYGHTHVADIKWEGKTLYINPGSATVPASAIE